jgi:hypothetical protein
MTPEFRNGLLAMAMVGRYRLGYTQMALLMAGALFEIDLNNKLIKYSRLSQNDIVKKKLYEKVNDVCKIVTSRNYYKDNKFCLFDIKYRHLFKKYRPNDKQQNNYELMSFIDNERYDQISKKLDNFKWIRNQIMHGRFDNIEFYKDDIDDMIAYIWIELAQNSFNSYFDDWINKSYKGTIFDSILKHSADYMIRGIDEVDIQEIDRRIPPADDRWCISLSDFRNLFVVRDKLVPLKNYLSQWLIQNNPHLHTNTLTTIDTSSAYIWMPLTRMNDETQSGIYECTVSILATPIDFRIYMDFGGLAICDRKHYYDFISSDQYLVMASGFVSTKPDLYVFDTEWFSFITKKSTVCFWLTSSNTNRKADLEAAKTEIDLIERNIPEQITWNRMLHGYIFDREYLAQNGCIDIELIKRCLTEIIHFNLAFEEYRSQKKELNI